MKKKTDTILCYPPNLDELDLASMVSMYRSRGEPRKAAPGKFLSCSHSKELIREGKWWFGLYYSQASWDALLTKNSNGFPMTETEFTAMGKIIVSDRPAYREEIENQIGVSSKLAYLILNDLKQFGFVLEDERGELHLSPMGESALNGISRRLYDKRFSPDLLLEHDRQGALSAAQKTGPAKPLNQASLF